MKKNIETENQVIEMDEETMQAIVEDNISIVPRNQRKKFNSLTLEQQISKIKFYQDMEQLRREARMKNSITNRVKELFEKRHASVDDAKKVMEFCQEFIDTYKLREIAKLDEQIARLEELKLQFA